jgi:RNA ligase (TIGR02306 family)
MSSTRRLSTVRFITAIEPSGMANYDLALIDGWRVVVEKGRYKLNQPVLYFEVDAFLPSSDPRFSPHAKRRPVHFDGVVGFRVQTEQINGVVSQGLVMPLAEFPEIRKQLNEMDTEKDYEETKRWVKEEACFDKILGIRKWESGRKSPGNFGVFPHIIQRTDIPRAQNSSRLWKKWGNAVFEVTAKMDGSSMTVYFVKNDHPGYHHVADNPDTRYHFPNGRFGVCARNVELSDKRDDNCNYWKVARKNTLAQKMGKLGRSVAIQGELVGDNVQQNREGFPIGFHDFFLFGAWDIEGQRRMTPDEVDELAQALELKRVPVLGRFRLKDFAANHDELVAKAAGRGVNGRRREGIVLKELNGQCHFKVIDPKYLLKHDE